MRFSLVLLLSVAAMAQTTTKVDWKTQIKNAPTLDARSYTSIDAAFSALGGLPGFVIAPQGSSSVGPSSVPNNATLIDWRAIAGVTGISATVNDYWRTGNADARAYIGSVYTDPINIGHLFSATSPSSASPGGYYGLAGFAQINAAPLNGVSLFGVCEVTVNNGACWGTNPIAASPPGVSAKLVGAEFDIEPSLGGVPLAGSLGIAINAFSEIITGASVIQSGNVGGGLFANGYAAGGITENGTALYAVPHFSTPGYSVVGTVNSGGACLIILSQVANEINTTQHVTVSGVGGTTGCNGTWPVVRDGVDQSRFILTGSTYNAAYTSGGTVVRTYDMDSLINATTGTYRSDAVLLGPSGGLRFYGTNITQISRIYSDVTTGQMVIYWNPGVNLADLGTVLITNGTLTYCPNCAVGSNPCSAGTGALAKRLNGVIRCD